MNKELTTRELRIGNKIQDNNGFIFDVVGICKDWVTADFESNEGDVWEFDYAASSFCYGIPLTEEILLKCGFEKDNDMFGKRLNNTAFIAIFPSGSYFPYELSNFRQKIVFDRGSFEGLHQLQNLFFSLTGQELTFNN